MSSRAHNHTIMARVFHQNKLHPKYRVVEIKRWKHLSLVFGPLAALTIVTLGIIVVKQGQFCILG